MDAGGCRAICGILEFSPNRVPEDAGWGSGIKDEIRMGPIVFAGRSRRPTLVLAASLLAAAWGSLLIAQEEKGSAAGDHPLVPAIKLAEEAREVAAQVKDYGAVLSKRELIGRKLVDQQMRIKCRQEPFSVYLFFEKPSQGREVLYVEGQNGGKLHVHEGGFAAIAGTFSFLPTDPKVMAENRYPITEIGLHRMLDVVIEQWKRELDDDDIEVRYYPNAKIRQQGCRVIETNHRRQEKDDKFYLTRLYIDKESGLPVRLEQYGWPPGQGADPPLMEMYMYQQIQANVGLTDQDFSTKNRQYKF